MLFPFPAFSPPMAGGNDQFSQFLMHFDGASGSTTFVNDAKFFTTSAGTRTGTSTISNAQSKFGGTSLSLPTNTSNVVYPVTGLSIPGDFTVDFWMRFSSIAAYNHLCTLTNSTLMLRATTNSIHVYTGNWGGSPLMNPVTNHVVNTWYHLALVKAGTTWTLYLNGAAVGSASSSATFAGANLRLGAQDGGAGNTGIVGFLDEFRLSNGIARWASNFTPPDGPYS